MAYEHITQSLQVLKSGIPLHLHILDFIHVHQSMSSINDPMMTNDPRGSGDLRAMCCSLKHLVQF